MGEVMGLDHISLPGQQLWYKNPPSCCALAHISLGIYTLPLLPLPFSCQEFDDDDEVMEGADDDGAKEVDDPGERKRLGIELDDEDEDEDDEDGAKLKKKLQVSVGRCGHRCGRSVKNSVDSNCLNERGMGMMVLTLVRRTLTCTARGGRGG